MATGAVATPVRPIGQLRHAALGLYWLGTYYVITPVYTILLQVQISQAVASHDTQNLVTGIATGIGGFLAMIIPPLVGHFSDRLHTRWGRRKPVIVAGTLGIVLCLVLLRLAGSLPVIVLGFALTVATINVASAAFVAVIPDTVHKAETGKASGYLGLFVQAGSVLSLLSLLAMSRAHRPGTNLFIGSAMGTLGVGLPFGLAARAARPEEPVFVFTGDGAFGLSAIELDTAARHGLGVVVVVVNNGGWGDVRHEQRMFYGEEADRGAELSSMRYDALALAVGGHGERVTEPAEVRPALERARDAAEGGVPAVRLQHHLRAQILTHTGKSSKAPELRPRWPSSNQSSWP